MSAVATGTQLEELVDADLVVRAQRGDDRATELLVSRYRGAVRARASNYFLVGADRDDLCQEGLIGLTKAIRDFDVDNGASFASFADLCITRQILTAIKMATRLKHTPLNTYVSYDRPHESDPNRTIADTVAVADALHPLESLLAEDGMRAVMAVVDEVLSGLEGPEAVRGRSLLPGDRRAAGSADQVDRQRPAAHQAQARGRAAPLTRAAPLVPGSPAARVRVADVSRGRGAAA